MFVALALSVVAGFLAFNLAHAIGPTTWYVDATLGSDATLDGSNPATPYATIQAAISAATTLSGDTVQVAAGTYNENVSITKSITLNGAQAGVAVGGRTFGAATESTVAGVSGGVGAITINAANVKVDGFSVTDVVPSFAAFGIVAKSGGASATITNNIIDTVTSADTGVNGTAQGVYLENGPDGVQILANRINNVHSTRSAKGISIGSNGNDPANNTVIEHNVITNIQSDTRGGYGILVSNASAGQSNLVFDNNTIQNVGGGGWVHAIGVEGDAPGASITNNTVSGLTASSTPAATNVYFESDASAGGTTITGNSFDLTNASGIQNTTAFLVTAGSNYWGTPSTGTIGAAMVGGVTFSPYYTDSVGGTLSVVPNVTFDATGQATSTNTPTYTFSSDVAASTFQCAVDGLATSSCSSPFTVTPGVSDGPHSLTVVATAPVTLVTGSATQTFTVDTTAPTVSSVNTTKADGTYGVGETIDFTVTFSEPVTVTGMPQLALNDGATANYSGGSSTDTLTFTYTVQGGENSAGLTYNNTNALTLNGGTIADMVGNAATNLTLPGSITGAHTIVIDTTGPVISSVSYSPTNGILAIGDILTVTVRTNEVGDTIGSGGFTVNGVAVTGFTDNGDKSYTAYYTVGSGDTDRPNTDQIPVSVTLKDTVTPNANETTFTTAPSAGLTPAIDANAPAAPSGPDMTAATDSGNSSSDDLTNNTTPTFIGTAEVGSTVRLFDGATQIGSYLASGGTWSIISSALAEGMHLIVANATDAVGNKGATSTALSVTVDTTAPAVGAPVLATSDDSGVSNSDNLTNVTTPTFTGTGEVGGTVTLYDTNGTTVLGTGTVSAGGVWSITSSALSQGAHTVMAKNTDPAGNTSAAAVIASPVVIDTTAPTLAEVTPITTPTNNTSPTYTFSSDESGSISYGGSCASTDTTAASGSNTVTFNAPEAVYSGCTVTVTDDAGNQSAALSVSPFTVDTTSPTVTLSSAVGTLTNVPFTVTATFSEPTTNFTIADITPSNATLSNFATTSLSNNEIYTFTVTPVVDGAVTVDVSAGVATDAATNPNIAANTIATTYDHTAPTLNAVSLVSNNASTTLAKVGDTVTITFTADEAITTPTVTIGGHTVTASGSGVGPYTATYVMTSTDTEGPVAFSVDFADLATNAGIQVTSTTDGSSVTFDRTAPTVTVTNSDADGVVIAGTPVTVTATFSEPVQDGPAPTLTVSGADSVPSAVMTKTDSTHYTYSYVAGSNTGTAVFTVDTAIDMAGNAQVANSGTLILDNTAPVITLNGASPDAAVTSLFQTYTDAGATATDNHDGVVAVHTTGAVSLLAPGTYTLTYTATDTVGNTSTSTRDVVVTVSGNNGQVSGGGGGGGGGGNGAPVGTLGNTTPTAVIPTVPAGGEVLGASTYHFTLTLRLGSRGTEVTELQKVLIAGGFLKIPAPTGYFGLLTQTAVKLYQTKYGIPSTGLVGPLTRAQLNK